MAEVKNDKIVRVVELFAGVGGFRIYIYIIRVARIGSKAEVRKDSHDREPRLVFDLEYLESLPNYKPVRLSILNTYTDTLLGRVLDAQLP